jgi:hypothetical protein
VRTPEREFDVIVCGSLRHYPEPVDIALSVTGDIFARP